MAGYLRDMNVRNKAFTASSIEQLFRVIDEAKARLIESFAKADDTSQTVLFAVVIRFDNQGYRVWSLQELQKYFLQAKHVERVSFELDTSNSLRTNRAVGAHCLLQLDSRDKNRCLFQVAADDRAWVEHTFAEVAALINKRVTVGRFVRTPLTTWLVQLSGISFGVVVCIWAARFVAPALSIENPFLIAFLVALLVFSNTWTHIFQGITWALSRIFPNVKFIRPDEEMLHWVPQAAVGSVIAVALGKLGTVVYDLVMFAIQGITRR